VSEIYLFLHWSVMLYINIWVEWNYPAVCFGLISWDAEDARLSVSLLLWQRLDTVGWLRKQDQDKENMTSLLLVATHSGGWADDVIFTAAAAAAACCRMSPFTGGARIVRISIRRQSAIYQHWYLALSPRIWSSWWKTEHHDVLSHFCISKTVLRVR